MKITIGMQTTQQKHIIPIAHASRPLFGSGAERTLPHLLSDDFVVTSKEGGIIERVDPDTNLAIIKYDSGAKEIIDLNPVMSKNSNGGFFLKNQKELIVEVGKRFKAGTILAKNGQYFLGEQSDDVTYSTGRLTKVAVAPSDYTYEDSSIIIEDMGKELASKITMKKTLNLGVNANIEQMVKVGDKVKTGDPLVIFEESFEDESINNMLASFGEEFQEFVQENAKNKLKSKYTGEIVDIVMYYNRDIEEFQPSVQKILKDYLAKGKKLKRVAKEAGEDINIDLPPVNKQKPGKIKGEDVDGIFIEIYIEYLDIAGVGDKITFYTALKTIISDVIPKGQEPFSEYNEDENIEAIFSPLSINSRMTTDVFNALYLGKALIELKRQVKKLYEE